MPVPVFHRRMNVGGVDVFYREAGTANAPVVLLPHGYPCSSYEFRDYIRHLGEDWRLLVSLRNHGRIDEGGWFDHVRLGFNYRLDDLSAALGIAQVERLERILALRREAAERYRDLLSGVDGVELPAPDDADHVRSWFVYVVKLHPELDRNGVIARLAEQGVASAPYLPCIHTQGYMKERYGFREGMFPVAEDASRRTLALPFFTLLDRDDQEYVAEALRTALG